MIKFWLIILPSGQGTQPGFPRFLATLPVGHGVLTSLVQKYPMGQRIQLPVSRYCPSDHEAALVCPKSSRQIMNSNILFDKSELFFILFI